MYKAMEPVYSKLFNILNDNFAKSENSETGIFSTVQRGLFFRDENVLASHLFPWAFVEYSETGSLEVKRSPEVYRYDLHYTITCMTFADRGDQDRLVFNPDVDGDTKFNKNPGIGDIVAEVGGFFWDNYHTNRLDIFDGEEASEEYAVNDWVIGGVGVPENPHVQMMMTHPYMRAVQFRFVFDITERTGFGIL